MSKQLDQCAQNSGSHDHKPAMTAKETEKFIMETHKKLRSRRRKSGNNRTAFWLSENAKVDLAYLKEFYRLTTGKEVTNSLVVRRALEKLTVHIKDVVAGKNHDDIRAEATALVYRCR